MTTSKSAIQKSKTGLDVRLACRSGAYTGDTAGLCPAYVQANLIILSKKYADDFRRLCMRNPTSCPLLGENRAPGDFRLQESLALDSDIRHDAPGYNVYQDGKLVEADIKNLEGHWKEDSVAFLIGCSFSFEQALSSNGLTPRHQTLGRNVPMYKTNVPLCPSGGESYTIIVVCHADTAVFTGNQVVSMRPYKASDIERVRDITRPYIRTHGEPVAWGPNAAAQLGISNIMEPEFGDAPVLEEGEVPVFWACGVTPQLVIMSSPAAKGVSIGHAPGKMVCLDIKVADMLSSS